MSSLGHIGFHEDIQHFGETGVLAKILPACHVINGDRSDMTGAYNRVREVHKFSPDTVVFVRAWPDNNLLLGDEFSQPMSATDFVDIQYNAWKDAGTPPRVVPMSLNEPHFPNGAADIERWVDWEIEAMRRAVGVHKMPWAYGRTSSGTPGQGPSVEFPERTELDEFKLLGRMFEFADELEDESGIPLYYTPNQYFDLNDPGSRLWQMTRHYFVYASAYLNGHAVPRRMIRAETGHIWGWKNVHKDPHQYVVQLIDWLTSPPPEIWLPPRPGMPTLDEMDVTIEDLYFVPSAVFVWSSSGAQKSFRVDGDLGSTINNDLVNLKDDYRSGAKPFIMPPINHKSGGGGDAPQPTGIVHLEFTMSDIKTWNVREEPRLDSVILSTVMSSSTLMFVDEPVKRGDGWLWQPVVINGDEPGYIGYAKESDIIHRVIFRKGDLTRVFPDDSPPVPEPDDPPAPQQPEPDDTPVIHQPLSPDAWRTVITHLKIIEISLSAITLTINDDLGLGVNFSDLVQSHTESILELVEGARQ